MTHDRIRRCPRCNAVASKGGSHRYCPHCGWNDKPKKGDKNG